MRVIHVRRPAPDRKSGTLANVSGLVKMVSGIKLAWLVMELPRHVKSR
jgi:hypothetical protein